MKNEIMEDGGKYKHSPAHLAVARRDHAALKKIVSALPRLAKAGEVKTEAESLAAELQAEAVSAVIDRRDVPGRQTPLHLAVCLGDAISAEILMEAGADWSLQNEDGWSALQEAICSRRDNIAIVIARHYQPLAWAKWCRRLPRIVASVARIPDFYMELTFHFESSVIPFISRIAPSDTYRIWKHGSSLRADMSLAGFDGLRIQRSDQTFLFLGEGYSGDMSLPPGSLIVLAHKHKEAANALEGAGSPPTDAQVAEEVALMSQTNMYRPGIDITRAELVPHLIWTRQERSEMVGEWKAKVYDMLHVTVSVKSRRVPGAMTDEELFSVDDDYDERMIVDGGPHDDYGDILSTEERMQLDSALRMRNSDGLCEEPENYDDGTKEKKSWFGRKKKGTIPNESKSLRLPGEEMEDAKKSKDKSSKKKKKKKLDKCESKKESKYKKGVRPMLWLTLAFPLKTEELLPLLDILANKVKAVRRLRELLTTKLPPGTFPVKIAIPVVPTIRVVITFTKFKHLQPPEEFATLPSSPQHFQDAKYSKESEASTSWISWMKGSNGEESSGREGHIFHDETDPFYIPPDYVWIDADEKKRRMKAKKAKCNKHRKQAAVRGGECEPHSSKNLEE